MKRTRARVAQPAVVVTHAPDGTVTAIDAVHPLPNRAERRAAARRLTRRAR